MTTVHASNAANSDSDEASTTSPPIIPKVYNDFADKKAMRADRDKRTIKASDIPLNFDKTDVTAAFSPSVS